jgi:hypothetical protein
MGVPRCDNRLVYVLERAGYTVLDPTFAVRAIELDTSNRTMDLYGTRDTVVGPVSTLLLSDQFDL